VRAGKLIINTDNIFYECSQLLTKAIKKAVIEQKDTMTDSYSILLHKWGILVYILTPLCVGDNITFVFYENDINELSYFFNKSTEEKVQ
jgi:hypothetical protein